MGRLLSLSAMAYVAFVATSTFSILPDQRNYRCQVEALSLSLPHSTARYHTGHTRRTTSSFPGSRLLAHPGHPFPAYYGTPKPEENDDDDMRYQFGRGVVTTTNTAMKSNGNVNSAVQERPPLQAPVPMTSMTNSNGGGANASANNSNSNNAPSSSSRRVPESNNFYEEYLRERQRRHIPVGLGAGGSEGSNGSGGVMSGSGSGAVMSGGGSGGVMSGMPVAPPPSLSRTPTPDYSSGTNVKSTGIFTPPAPATASKPPPSSTAGRRPDFSPYRSNVQRPSSSAVPSAAVPSTTQPSGPGNGMDAAASVANRELILSKLDTLAKQQHDWNDRLTNVEIKMDRQSQDHEARTRRLLEEFRIKNEQTTQSFLKTVTKDIQGMQMTLSNVVNDQKQLQLQQATTAKRLTELETSQVKKLTEMESKHEAKISKLQEEQSTRLQEVRDGMAKKHQQEIDAVKLAIQEDQKAQADRLVAFEKAQVERLTAFEDIQQERTQEQLERAMVDMMQEQQLEHQQMMMEMDMDMDMDMEHQGRRRRQGPPTPRMEEDLRRGPPPTLPQEMQREPDLPPPKKGMLRDRLMQKGDQEQLYQSPNKKKTSGSVDVGAPAGTDRDDRGYRMRMEDEEHMMMMEDQKRRLEDQAWRKDPLIPPPPQGPRPIKKGGRDRRHVGGTNGSTLQPPGRYSDDDDEQAMMMRRQRLMMIDGEEDAMDFGPPPPPRGGSASRDDLLIVDDDMVDNMIGQALNNYRPFQGDDLLAKNPFDNDSPVPMAGKGSTGGASFGRRYGNDKPITDARRIAEPASGIKSAAASPSNGGTFRRRGAADAVVAEPPSKDVVMGDLIDNKMERDGVMGRNHRGRNDFGPAPPPPSSVAATSKRNGPSIDDRLEHFLRETTKSGPKDHFNKEMESLLMEKYRPMYEWLTPNNALFLRNVLVTFMEHRGCQVEMDLKNATEQAAYEWEELLNILAFELYRLTGEEPRIVSEGSNKWGIYDQSGKPGPNGRRRERNNFAVSKQP